MIKKIVTLMVSISIFSLVNHSSTQAAGLKVVFQDTMWGGALGTIVGAAVWGLEDRSADEKISTFSLRGLSIGILGGMAYGFYEAEYKKDQYGQFSSSPVQGLVHYDRSNQVLVISPGYALISGLSSHSGEIPLFSTSF